MLKKYLSLILLIFLVGCAYNPIPKGYKGPTAMITDTYEKKEESSAQYYVLNSIDKKFITNSFGETRQKNYGRGTVFTPAMVSRDVLPKEQEFKIQAFIFYPTDALSLFSDSQSVEKSIIFEPKADEEYFVKGSISPNGSEVWLEDSQGNQIK